MKVICYGDSNTWGYNPKDGSRFDAHIRWTKRLSEYGDFEVIEEGLNGRTMNFEDPLNPNRCGQKELQMIIETHQPFDVLVIMLGTNDMIEMYHCDSETIATGTRNLIRIAKNPFLWETYAMPKVLVIAPIPFHENMHAIQDMISYYGNDCFQKVKELPGFMKEFCDHYHCDFLDVSQDVCASSIDGVHLDEEGHARLAQRIAEKLLMMDGETKQS